MDNFITIDFGTTACCAACDKGGTVEIISNRYSDGRMPLLIEQSNNNRFSFDFTSIKQKIGFEEAITSYGKKIRVIDLAADIFRGIRDDAKTNMSEHPENAVVTVPAGFSEKQRAAIRTAAEKAGFTFVKLLDESAALMLGAGIKNTEKAFVVYSLGGGFFTVSVFNFSNGVIKTLCHEGDRNLGGYSFDHSLMNYLVNVSGSSLVLSSQTYPSIQKFKSLVEHLKISLSRREQVEIDLDLNDYFDIGIEAKTRNKFNHVLSRADFEKIISNDIEKTLVLTKKAIQDAGLSKDDIESVMLVGGSTKIPYIENMLSDQFGNKIVRLSNETILKGATIYGRQLPDPPSDKSCETVAHGDTATSGENEASDKSDTKRKFKEMWLSEFPKNLINAQSLWEKGNQDKSIAILEEMSAQLSSFIGNIFCDRGNMFMRLRDYDEAMRSFERALKHSKDDGNAKHAYHQAHRGKGDLLVEKGALHEAAIFIKKGLSIEPECRGCREFLAKIEIAIRNRRSPKVNFVSGFKSRKKKR